MTSATMTVGFAEVFEVATRAPEQGLSANERLALHQQQSQPVLEDLKKWLDGLLDDKQVEPITPVSAGPSPTWTTTGQS